MPRIATPSSTSWISAWNVETAPSSNDAAHTVTAVPPSISRPSPTMPPAPQPMRTSGASTSWTPSSVAAAAARWAPEAKTTARSTSAAAHPGGDVRGRLDGPRPGIGGGRQAARDAHRHGPLTIALGRRGSGDQVDAERSTEPLRGRLRRRERRTAVVTSSAMPAIAEHAADDERAHDRRDDPARRCSRRSQAGSDPRRPRRPCGRR